MKITGLIAIPIGLVCGIAGLLSMQPSIIRTVSLVAVSSILIVGFVSLVMAKLGLRHAYSILSNSKKLGISNIFIHGDNSRRISRYINSAIRIRILAVSAQSAIKLLRDDLIAALGKHSARVQVLLADGDSQLIKDVENIESPARVGAISNEIQNTLGLLQESINEAKKSYPTSTIGKIEVGYYRTHIRNSIIICNDDIGWLTLSLPPRRAIASPALEIIKVESGLLSICSVHFDEIWRIMSIEERITEIRPD
jgi:hypothetical protein